MIHVANHLNRMKANLSKSNELIKFNDLNSVDGPMLKDFQNALEKIIDRSAYVLGEEISHFEEELRISENADFAVAVNSGTSALIIALKALGIGQGDEVITTNLTFVATCFAILEVGAVPVLVDVDPSTLILNPKLLMNSLTKKTKAMIIVTLHGRADHLTEFREFSLANNLKLIIDGAQSQMAKYHKSTLVNYCDLLTLSFYPGKNLGSLGEGGCVLGKNSNLGSEIALMRNWGMKEKYVATSWGGNFRIENLQAAFLRIKLKNLNELTQLRIEKAAYYFEKLPGSMLLKKPLELGSHVYHIFSIKTKKRNQLIEKFKEEKIEFGIHYPVPISQQPYYKYKCKNLSKLNVSEEVSQEILSIPFYPLIPYPDMDRVINVITKFEDNEFFSKNQQFLH